MNIHNSIMDIHNSICILLKFQYAFIATHNAIKDIHN